MQRRNFIAAALAPAAFGRAALAADAASGRPIQVIVPYAAGGADTYIRPLQPGLQARHGIQLVIETVVGAGGTIGSARVKRAPADGQTLLFCGSGALTIAPRLQDGNAPTPADFTPVLSLVDNPYVIAMRKGSPIRSAAAFIDFIKRNPGQLNYGSPGIGSAPHLGMEALAARLNTSVTHVPFTGVSAAMQALLGGHVDAIIGAPSTVVPQMRQGAVTGIAVTGHQRYPYAPELPVLSEAAGVDVDVVTRFAFYAPKGTPAAVTERLAAALRDVAAQPDYLKAMEGLQTQVAVQGGDALARALAAEEQRFAPVIAMVRKR